ACVRLAGCQRRGRHSIFAFPPWNPTSDLHRGRRSAHVRQKVRGLLPDGCRSVDTVNRWVVRRPGHATHAQWIPVLSASVRQAAVGRCWNLSLGAVVHEARYLSRTSCRRTKVEARYAMGVLATLLVLSTGGGIHRLSRDQVPKLDVVYG